MAANSAGICGNSVLLTNSLHASNLLRALDASRKNPSLCDGIVVIGEDEIPIQKNVLVASSPYFRAMFDYDCQHYDGHIPQKHVMNITDLSKATFEEILDYIYTSCINLSEDNIQDILQAADILLLRDLKDLCCDYLEECITIQNCLGIREFTERFSCPRVNFLATEYLDEHFSEVSYTDEFLHLPSDKLCEILTRENLNVQSEQFMCDSLLRWIEFDIDERVATLPALFSSTLLLGMLNRDTVLTHDLVQRTHMQSALIKEMEKGQHNMQCRPRGYTEVIVVAGGQQPRRHGQNGELVMVSNKVYCMIPSNGTGQWLQLPPMKTCRMGHGLISAGGCLYAIGGKDYTGQIINTGEMFDPQHNSWQSMPPMAHARIGFGLLAIEDKVYAIGGSNDMSDPLTSIEEYNIYTKTWRRLPSMSLKRAWSACAVLGKKLFVIGGGVMGKLYESVECFDTKSETWTSIAPMKERRFDARAVGTDNRMYVFGGLRRFECPSAMHAGNSMKFCSTEMYSDDTKHWYSVGGQRDGMCTMSESSHLDGVIACNNEIYVVGELNVGNSYECIRAYQLNSQTWRNVMTKPPAHLQYMQCCSLKLSNSILRKLSAIGDDDDDDVV